MNAAPASDPKRRVISHLKRNGSTSTQQVARVLEVSDVAARQHLASLELQGLVQKETAPPAGKGRPAVLWSLTPLANDLFPDRHDALTVDLIDGIRKALGEDGLQRVIAVRTARQLAALRETVHPEAPLRERLEALARQRTLEGYMAEVGEADDGALLLIEHHCPICDAAKACRAFCSTELELFEAALGPDVTVERRQHLLSGNERCVYRVTPWPKSG
ncbi:MAG TPA: metalloregulator ArsR/SmtB family transcription factor [Dehalococcoidia bacterium]|nr:metalloregulator ArsR/SmtB family transcription factor [Dehalococcoidia bacterium]